MDQTFTSGHTSASSITLDDIKRAVETISEKRPVVVAYVMDAQTEAALREQYPEAMGADSMRGIAVYRAESMTLDDARRLVDLTGHGSGRQIGLVDTGSPAIRRALGLLVGARLESTGEAQYSLRNVPMFDTRLPEEEPKDKPHPFRRFMGRDRWQR